MSKIICEREDIVAIADGFRTSRDTTIQYSLEQMAKLAGETVGGTVQTATGSFTSLGYNGLVAAVDCGFTPDVVFFHLPEGYSEGSQRYANDIAINMAGTSMSLMGVSMSGDLYEDYYYVGLYVTKTESGFDVFSIYEQSLSGDYWYPIKNYSYTAIKYI